MGFVDGCSDVDLANRRSLGDLKFNPKYLNHPASKIRTTLPFLTYFRKVVGEKKFEDYCDWIEVDSDAFYILDAQINVGFSIDVLHYLVQHNHLDRRNIGVLSRPVSEPTLHGKLHVDYDRAPCGSELFKALFDNILKYEMNFEYRIESISKDSMDLTVKPRSHMHQFRYKSDTLGSFLCDYKQSYIRQFSTYNSCAPVRDLVHKECHYRGAERCIYQVKFA
jgi:hypothetical protein